MIEEIDRLLERDRLDEQIADRLCELLDSGAESGGFDIEEVLHLAEHPVILDAVEQRELPGALQQRIAEAIGAVSGMLGESSGAPLGVQARRLRRCWERERKKFRMVRQRLDEKGLREGSEILGRYLDTSPAPMFSRRLASQFQQMYDRACSSKTEARRLLTGDDRLVELLQFESPLDDRRRRQLTGRLESLVEELDDPEATAGRALAAAEGDKRLVAAALAVHTRMRTQAHPLLMDVVRGGDVAPQAAAFAAHLAPSLARHVLGRFLVDVLNDGTPTEDLQVDRQKLREAIVAARTVLPLIGSPLDDLEQIDTRAQQIAGKVRRGWDWCTASYGEPDEN